MPRPRRRLPVVVIATLLSVGVAAPGAAADAPLDLFRQTVARYRDDATRAATTHTASQDEALLDGVDRCLVLVGPVCPVRDVVTGVMLLTDLADAGFGDSERRGRTLLAGALRLGDFLRSRPQLRDGVDPEFLPRWFAHAGRFLTAQRLLPDARAAIDRALRDFPSSVDLRVARGLTYEMPAYWDTANYRGTRATLGVALGEYEQAARTHPSAFEPRLRLAWLRDVLRDRRAPDDAASVLTGGADADTIYLAHLLLAGFAERRGDAAVALAEYARAQESGPHYKAACIGLSRMQELAGQTAAAAATAADCLQRHERTELIDPWLDIRIGLTPQARVHWLRREARRP